MSSDIVYLDYAATTPVDPRVAECLANYLTADGVFANPSAIHVAGRRAADAVEHASSQLAALLNCEPARLVWTSGATESNNLAIGGAARHREDRGKHLVTASTEHKAVTGVFRALEKQGYEVTWLEPGCDGKIDVDAFGDAIRDDTQLASVMFVNNETGVVQDIQAIGSICRDRDVLFHVDAAQGIGKLPFDVSELPVDLVSVTAHKMYGPKGIGALYIADRPGCHLEPLMYGGGQQRRQRPGTLPVHLIAAFGLAADIAALRRVNDLEHVTGLRERLWQGLQPVDGVAINGPGDGYPGILSVRADDIEGESLLLAMEPVCVASGSACNSRNQEPSYVLRALGLSDIAAQSSIRFSFGRMTTNADIDTAIEHYRAGIEKLRAIAPEAAA